MSIFLVERTSISIAAKFDAGNLGRSPAHLLTYSIEGHLRLTLDYALIVDMAADKAMCAYDTLELRKGRCSLCPKSIISSTVL